MLLQIKLVSTLTRHGASFIKDSAQTSLAIKKSKDILGKRDKAAKVAGEAKSENHNYGLHNGSVQVHTFAEHEGNAEELDKILDTLSPKINTFRNIPAMDLRMMKKQYGDFLENLTQEYDSKYGGSLSPALSVEFTNKCAQKSFKYHRHQIVIRFIGTLDEFEDQERLSPYGKKGDVQLFITEVKVKSVFTLELLTLVQINAIATGSDKVVKATSRDIAFTMELRTGPYGSRFKKIPLEDIDDDDFN